MALFLQTVYAIEKLLTGFNVQWIRRLDCTADDVTWVHRASNTFLHSQLKLFDYCLNCGVYDIISATQLIDFLLLKVIDNFNILKINAKGVRASRGYFGPL